MTSMKRGTESVDGGDSAPSGGHYKRKRTTYTYMDPGTHDRYRDGYRHKNAKDPVVKTLADDKETDSHRLAQRQKQIDYGKNTIGYDRYCDEVPRHQRRRGKHPMTPDKTIKIGKKVFDGIVRKWRQALHKYDPPELVDAASTNDTEVRAEPSIFDAKDGKVMTGSPATELTKTSDVAMTTPPSRSIYENFDEDNSGEENDSDEDLL